MPFTYLWQLCYFQEHEVHFQEPPVDCHNGQWKRRSHECLLVLQVGVISCEKEREALLAGRFG